MQTDTHQVFFTQINNITQDNPLELYPVDRESSRTDIANYLIEQELIGPNQDEQNQGFSNFLLLFKPDYNVQSEFKIPDDYNLVLEKPQSETEASNLFEYTLVETTAKINFKRNAYLAGDLSASRIKQQIEKTLLQLPEIKKTYITFNGDACWDDMSGKCEEL